MTFEDAELRSSIELTRDEMLAISEEISFKFSPSVRAAVPSCASAFSERPQGGFSHKELQAIGEDIARRFAPKTAASQAEILLLPVDPRHLYAFWEAGYSPPPPVSGRDLPAPLTLRIYWRPDARETVSQSNVWFDLPADAGAGRKKIRLPIDGTFYSAALGKLYPDYRFEALARSNLVHVPEAPESGRSSVRGGAQEAAGAGRETPAGFDLQERLQTICRNGSLFSEDWMLRLHPSSQSASTNETVSLYSELMNIFDKNRMDVELIPVHLPQAARQCPFKHASGLGL